MKFSERIGIIKAKDEIQLDFMDEELRNGLWNAVQIFYLDEMTESWVYRSKYEDLLKNLWHNFFKIPLDTMDDSIKEIKFEIRNWFFGWEWYEVYDFIEYLASFSNSPTNVVTFMRFCDNIFKKELSGYRFNNGIIAPITNESEISEIDSAISTCGKKNMFSVKTHLESALSKLADRKNPDYRNSIKESISAIESLAQIISDDEKDSLGGALSKISVEIKLHTSLVKGFKQIYGYTSDADGIRHALSDQSTCDFEDAKYMLVTSSAFINYLIAKANKAGIKI